MKTGKIELIVVLLVAMTTTTGLVQVAYADAAGTKDATTKTSASKDAGGPSMAEKATNPTSILTQLQLQNVFIPSTYDADGYSNQFIIQPVLPMKTGWDTFPMHIIRLTLPLNVLTADPDGPINETSGVGDLTVFDLFRAKPKKWGAWGIGPVAVFPTASDDRLGQGKYQLGPAFMLVNSAVPKWQFGVLIQNPISFAGDSDRDSVSTLSVQPIAIRHFQDGWYAGLGDMPMTREWLNGDYNFPLNLRIGKVTKIGKQPVNMFIQPFWTPSGFHKGQAAEWGIKFNLTLLFP
jgi:hypothetical protein